MLFSKAALVAAAVTFMVFVDAKDVTCKKGKKTTEVTLNEGDTFSFRSVRGFLYAGRQRCRVNYKLGKCSAASVSCSTFDLKADKICRTGDSITINSRGSEPRKFCRSKGPKDVSFKKPFSVFFKSNKWKGGAFKCEVSCTAGPPLPRMIIRDLSTNQILSVNLDNGEMCGIPSYPGSEIGVPSNAAAYIESIGAPVMVGECIAPSMCGTYTFNGTGWESLNQPTGNYSGGNSYTHSVKRGNELWISGLDAVPLYQDGPWDTDVYSSEIFNGSTWTAGPQYSSDFPVYACTVQIDEATTMVTGGYKIMELSNFSPYDFHLNNVSTYDWSSNAWMESAPLNESRLWHGCALLQGQGVLVAGGFGNQGPLASVELFDLQSKLWVEQPSFPIVPQGTPILMSWGTTVIGLFGDGYVWKRSNNGTWEQIEGVELSFPALAMNTDAFLIPEEYTFQCSPITKVNRLTKKERDQAFQEQLKSVMPSHMAGFIPV